jgi:hypothetical protein
MGDDLIILGQAEEPDVTSSDEGLNENVLTKPERNNCAGSLDSAAY